MTRARALNISIRPSKSSERLKQRNVALMHFVTSITAAHCTFGGLRHPTATSQTPNKTIKFLVFFSSLFHWGNMGIFVFRMPGRPAPAHDREGNGPVSGDGRIFAQKRNTRSKPQGPMSALVSFAFFPSPPTRSMCFCFAFFDASYPERSRNT